LRHSGQQGERGAKRSACHGGGGSSGNFGGRKRTQVWGPKGKGGWGGQLSNLPYLGRRAQSPLDFLRKTGGAQTKKET